MSGNTAELDDLDKMMTDIQNGENMQIKRIEITGYASTTASVSSDNYAQLNRLTITIRVEFTNLVEPKNSFVQTFSQFADYDSQQLLTDIQSELDQQIVDQIVTDIFMAAAANW